MSDEKINITEVWVQDGYEVILKGIKIGEFWSDDLLNTRLTLSLGGWKKKIDV